MEPASITSHHEHDSGRWAFGNPFKGSADLFRRKGELWPCSKRFNLFSGEEIGSIDILTKTLEWRSEYGVADILSWGDLLTLENATGKTYVRGCDQSGHPLIIIKPRNENTSTYEDNLKYLVYNLECAVLCSTNEDCKFSILIDFEGFSLTNAPPLQASLDTVNILQNYYPEHLHRCFYISPPWIAFTAYNFIYPFIDAVTVAKVR